MAQLSQQVDVLSRLVVRAQPERAFDSYEHTVQMEASQPNMGKGTAKY